MTLEPCSHHGRTPPCADALIAAGIARVVAAMQDPNPRVAGSGFARLRAAGIEVESGLMQDEARELNIGFVSRMSRGRPWVRMKIAASLDGRTALANGESQWITGEAARRDGHHWRARACAVLTGIGTVRDDDPQLNVREVETPRQPLKVLVDSRLEVPAGGACSHSGRGAGRRRARGQARSPALRAQGAEVLVLPNRARQGGTDGTDARTRAPRNQRGARRGRHEAERLAAARGLVDELLVYLAPSILGDTGRGMFSLPELTDLAQKSGLQSAT